MMAISTSDAVPVEVVAAIRSLEGVIDATRFVGRAPEQVDEFLRDVITPLFAGETVRSEHAEELRV